MFARTDKSVTGKWWWTVDKWNLTAIILLTIIGCLLILSASPSAALRLGSADSLYFIKKHLIFLPVAWFVLCGFSMMQPKKILTISGVMFTLFVLLTFITIIYGQEIKGSKRWLQLGMLSIQPTEFLKPTFAIITAWLLSLYFKKANYKALYTSIILLILLMLMLIAQPDNGMAMILFLVWAIQLIIASASTRVVAFIAVAFIAISSLLYISSSNFKHRIDSYLSPAVGDQFQIEKSLQAFKEGGMLGVGPGEGSIKENIPDIHTDFILAIAGEEGGVIVCLLIVSIFVFIMVRGSNLALKNKSLFAILSVSGLLSQLGPVSNTHLTLPTIYSV